MPYNKQRRLTHGSIAGILASVLALPFGASAQDEAYALSQFDTGMVFESQETYDALPKRKRTRGVVMFDQIDLSSYFPPAGDQSAQGSCGSWAVGYGARSYYLSAETGRLGFDDAISPAYIFNQISPGAFDENVRCSGTTFTAALDLLRDVGAVDMTTWPYDPSTCRPTPTDELLTVAASNRIPDYTSFNSAEIKDTRRFKEVLASGHPIIIAATIVVKDFLSYRGGVYSRPDMPDTGIGGHGMVVVGFDDDKQAFLIYNSWGQNWGMDGKMWIDYDTFHQQVREAYVIEGLSPPKGVFSASVSGLPAYSTLATTLGADLGLKPKPKDEAAPDAPAAEEEFVPAPEPEPEPEPEIVLTLDEKRQAIDEMTSQLRCGKAELVRGDTDQLIGFAGPDERNDFVQAVHETHPDARIEVNEMAWPACEIAMMLPANTVDTDLTLSVDTLDALEEKRERQAAGEVEDAETDAFTRLQDDDRFRIAAGASTGPSFFQIFYLQADQSAKEIFRGETNADDLEIFGVAIGDQVAGLRSSPPFGAEAVLVMATDAPVIEGDIRLNVAEFDFIEQLQEGLTKVTADGREFVSVLYPLQVLGRDTDAIDAKSLLTTDEYEVFESLFGADVRDVSQDPTRLIQEQGALELSLSNEDGALVFETPDTESVSFELLYRTPSGLVDITPRLDALSELTETSLRISDFAMPAGAHRLRLVATSAADQISALEFTVGETEVDTFEDRPVAPIEDN